MLLDQVDELLGGETLGHRIGTALEQYRHDHRARGMGDRRQCEKPDFCGPIPVGHLGHDHRDMHAVGVRDTLGLAGGAAGVDQHADVVGLRLGHESPGGEARGCGQDVFAEAVVRPEAQQAGHARHALGERAGAVRKGQRVDEQRLHARVGQDVGVVVLRRSRVDPGDAQAHHIGHRSDQEGFRAVRRQCRDRVAALQAARCQGLNDRADQRAELAVGPAGVIRDEGHPVAAATDGRDHQIADIAAVVQRLRHHRPRFRTACWSCS